MLLFICMYFYGYRQHQPHAFVNKQTYNLIYFFENGSFRENIKYFFICNHVIDCSALRKEQQLCHEINRHFSTYV